ncbi:MAG: hypothetical protein WA364_09475, partial [Candidatus Nitrosopolaris sp.]
MELDEESLTSSKKPTEGEVVDKTTCRQTRPKQEQEQREVHKVSVKLISKSSNRFALQFEFRIVDRVHC